LEILKFFIKDELQQIFERLKTNAVSLSASTTVRAEPVEVAGRGASTSSA
jgi:hypothetical protein